MGAEASREYAMEIPILTLLAYVKEG